MALIEMTADTQFDEGWEAEEADKQEQDPAADPEEDKAGEKPDTESNKVELEDKEEPETKGEAGDDTQDVYKFDDPIKKRIQKVKTLEGMYNSEKKRQTQLEKELADLKTQMSVRVDEKPKEEVAAKKEEGIDDVFENIPSLKKLKEEYGEEIAGALTDMAKHLSGKYENKITQIMASIKNLSSTIDPITESYTKSTSDNHYKTIKAAHDDFEKYRDNGEIVSWMDSLPAYKKEGYKKAYSDGSTEEVIDLIGTFKEAMGYAEKSNETPKGQAVVRPAGMAVKTKTAPVQPAGKRKEDPNDFDGAWETK